MLAILRRLTEACREPSPCFQGVSAFRPRVVVQDMLRHLGAFEVVANVLGLEASIADASLEAGEKTKEVLKLAFLFLAWVVHGNAENQQLAHDQNLEEIVDKLGEDYFAALPLAEIFRGNMKLVKQFPTRLVGKLIEYAVQAEHDPAFLEVGGVAWRGVAFDRSERASARRTTDGRDTVVRSRRNGRGHHRSFGRPNRRSEEVTALSLSRTSSFTVRVVTVGRATFIKLESVLRSS
jgi:hypothetical protein